LPPRRPSDLGGAPREVAHTSDSHLLTAPSPHGPVPALHSEPTDKGDVRPRSRSRTAPRRPDESSRNHRSRPYAARAGAGGAFPEPRMRSHSRSSTNDPS